MSSAPASPPAVDQWLVRTAENYIAGPYTRDQIRQLIHEGQLGFQDEVCPANTYWIFLHERDEVIRQLGADVLPWLVEAGEDITQTETERSIEEITLTERRLAESQAQAADGSTTIIAALPSSGIRLKERRQSPAAILKPVAANSGEETAPLVHVSPSGHTGFRWRALLWFLVTFGAIAIFWLLHWSRQH